MLVICTTESADTTHNRVFPTLHLSRHLQYGAEWKWQIPRQPLRDGNAGNTQNVMRHVAKNN